MKNVVLKAFIAGYLAMIAVSSLYHDVVGKDEYIRKLQEGWTSAGITVPLSLVVLLLAAALTYSAHRDAKEKTNG